MRQILENNENILKHTSKNKMSSSHRVFNVTNFDFDCDALKELWECQT